MAVRAIRRDGKVWRWEVTLVGADGRQQRRRFPGTPKGRREAEAHEAAERVRRLAGRGELRADELTLGQLVALWQADHEVEVRTATVTGQRVLWAALEPLVGDVRLDQLRSGQLDDAMRHLATRAERPYALSSLTAARVMIGQPLRWAVDRGIIDRNPVRTMRPLRTHYGPREDTERVRVVWSVEDVRRVMVWADGQLADPETTRCVREPGDNGPRYGVLLPMVLTMLWTGLRYGEAAALTWDDVRDGDVPVLQVRRTMTRAADGGVTTGPPKTRASRRAVAILGPAAVAIATQRDRQRDRREVRQALGRSWGEGGYVFDDGLGMMAPINMLRRCLAWIARGAGVPVLSPHGLRHTFATVALEAGVPGKVVQDMLGHASIAMTLDLYAHVTADAQRGAGEVLAGIAAAPRSNVLEG